MVDLGQHQPDANMCMQEHGYIRARHAIEWGRQPGTQPGWQAAALTTRQGADPQ